MKLLSTLCFLFFFSALLSAQSTGLSVYQILQEKCVQCHDNASPEAGLDLEGQGPNESLRALYVRNRLVNVTPANASAAAKGLKYIYPGRVDKSFLFHKVNQGLEPLIGLDAGDGQSMPPYGQSQLSATEKELIRQWILHGATSNGTAVNPQVLEDYYTGNALQAFPDGAPPAPAEGEGFQIKMGPFYLAPGGETEYFQKYELELPEDMDVNRLEIMMGNYSHHFLLYDFNPGGSNSISPGLRLNANHSDIGLVAAVQESTDLNLPAGTAFIWDNNLVLDLNSHYINYSNSSVYQAEAYVNVYTQPAGTAAQEMHTVLVSNLDISIPNNGAPVTFTDEVVDNLGEVFVWGLMGHTHKYGTGYKIYRREPGGEKGEILYDAACARGIPGCIAPFFDYQHIPMRYFDPLLPVDIDFNHGFIHEASWINDGPSPVWFGPTSEDEMMVMIAMYTEDTTGLSTDIRELPGPKPAIANVFPNPVRESLGFSLPADSGEVEVQLLDATGRAVLRRSGMRGPDFRITRNNIPAGLYFYHIRAEQGQVYNGKVILE